MVIFKWFVMSGIRRYSGTTNNMIGTSNPRLLNQVINIKINKTALHIQLRP